MISTSEACEEDEHFACEYETESDSYLCACPCHTDYDGNDLARWADEQSYLFESYFVGQGMIAEYAAWFNCRVSDVDAARYEDAAEIMRQEFDDQQEANQTVTNL